MRLGCVACAHYDIPNIAQECHHLLEGNIRMGDWYTIPLCRGHHQGDWTAEQREVLGELCVAISDGRKAFRRFYPSERTLWERVQKRMGLDTVWPVSKLAPRSVA